MGDILRLPTKPKKKVKRSFKFDYSGKNPEDFYRKWKSWSGDCNERERTWRQCLPDHSGMKLLILYRKTPNAV